MRRTRSNPKRWAAVLTLTLAAVWTLDGARGANPSSAEYSKDSEPIFWILHISDSHIGASAC